METKGAERRPSRFQSTGGGMRQRRISNPSGLESKTWTNPPTTLIGMFSWTYLMRHRRSRPREAQMPSNPSRNPSAAPLRQGIAATVSPGSDDRPRALYSPPRRFPARRTVRRCRGSHGPGRTKQAARIVLGNFVYLVAGNAVAGNAFNRLATASIGDPRTTVAHVADVDRLVRSASHSALMAPIP